jgi:GDP-D-mannose 3', 5'-epimerase
MKSAIVLGSSGFIGTHLVRRLKAEGYWVRGVDVKRPPEPADADDFVVGDLKKPEVLEAAIAPGLDELYQLAADMGGAGYIFTGVHDADLMYNSALINLHTAAVAHQKGVGKVFYSSSACIYPRRNQQDPAAPHCGEDSAYPADPDSEYGWEKLFSERVYGAFQKTHHLDVRIARLHNVYGPGNTWCGGREKAPAALCRKVSQAREGEEVEIWGDGQQTRSFLYIDDCLEGIRALMESDCIGPANIGSEEMISIDDFALLVIRVAGKNLKIRHVPGPVGVRGRNSDNRLMQRATGWRPRISLEDGISRTYRWVAQQLEAQWREATALSSPDRA